MKIRNYLVHTSLLLTLLLPLFTGCSKQKHQEEKVYLLKQEHNTTTNKPEPVAPKVPTQPQASLFHIVQEHNQSLVLKIAKNTLTITPSQPQDWIVIHLFDANQTHGDAMLSYLRKYGSNHYTLLSFKEESKGFLPSGFTLQEDATTFVKTLQQSLSLKNEKLPLTLLYKKGQYFMDYEGMTPIEMILHTLEANQEKMKQQGAQ